MIGVIGVFVAATEFSATAAGLTWTPLSLKNSWAAYGDGTRDPAAALNPTTNFVHFRGAMAAATGMSGEYAFRLTANKRPAALLYLPVDACDATHARIVIQTDGWVYFSADDATNLECFVSIEGVSFARDGAPSEAAHTTGRKQRGR